MREKKQQQRQCSVNDARERLKQKKRDFFAIRFHVPVFI